MTLTRVCDIPVKVIYKHKEHLGPFNPCGTPLQVSEKTPNLVWGNKFGGGGEISFKSSAKCEN